MKKDRETFNHMMTVVMIILGDAREAILGEFKTDKEWEESHDKEKKLFKDAKKYVRSWIKDNIKY